MNNYRGTGKKVVVTAAAPRTSGQAVVEQQIAGVAETSAASGERYSIITEGVFSFPQVASAAVGDLILIDDTDQTVTCVAYGTSITQGSRLLGTVVAVDQPDSDQTRQSEVQAVSVSATGGTFTLTFDDTGSNPQTTSALAYDVSAADMQTALRALSNIGASDVTVAGTAPYVVTFAAGLAALPQRILVADNTSATGGMARVARRTAGQVGTMDVKLAPEQRDTGGPSIAIVETTKGDVSNDEVQTVTLTDATGGSFTLTYSGQTTAAIAYNATGATVQTRLRALSNLTPAKVTVTGSAGGPYTVTFVDALAKTDVAMITYTSSLTP